MLIYHANNQFQQSSVDSIFLQINCFFENVANGNSLQCCEHSSWTQGVVVIPIINTWNAFLRTSLMIYNTHRNWKKENKERQCFITIGRGVGLMPTRDRWTMYNMYGCNDSPLNLLITYSIQYIEFGSPKLDMDRKFNNLKLAIKVYFNVKIHIQDHRDLKKRVGELSWVCTWWNHNTPSKVAAISTLIY